MDRKPQRLKNIWDCDEYSWRVASLSIPSVSNILYTYMLQESEMLVIHIHLDHTISILVHLIKKKNNK